MKRTIAFFMSLIVLSTTVASAQKLYTKTFKVEDELPNGTGWSYWFIPTGSVADTLNVKMSCVNKGTASHTPHRHNHDEYFILLEGEAIIQLNGEDHVLHAGDGFLAPGDGAHSLRRVSEDIPIRYLMFNREAKGGVKTPFPFWKENYTADDCYAPFQDKKDFWYVSPEMTLNGLNVRNNYLKANKSRKSKADNRYLVYVIMEGSADIKTAEETVTLPAMSVCYVPAGTASSIRATKGTGPVRYLTARIH